MFWRECLEDAEPEIPTAELAWDLSPAPGLMRSRLAVATAEGEIVGAMVNRAPLRGKNSTFIAWAAVAPAWRGRRMGRRMLDLAISWTHEMGRDEVHWRTPQSAPGPQALAQSLGAVRAGVQLQNRLATRHLDSVLMQAWSVAPAGYEVVMWDGATPDEWLGDYAALTEVISETPGHAATTSTDDVRRDENRWLARGSFWRVCARNRRGRLVAFSEMHLPRTRPGLAEQGDLGVHPDHRGRGLARCLKATTALRLVHERPDITRVETWNSEDNAPILAINRAMGYRTACAWQAWELRLDRR